MKSNRFNIKTYSAFACAFLINANTQAEVEYTDIEPDIILDADFESDGVDMDNNGTIDFAFLNFSYPWYYNPWYSFIERIFVGPYGTPLNEVAGTGSLFYFPYAIEFGNFIDFPLSFQNYGFQIMAWYKFISLETGSGEIVTFTGYGGEWYPEKLDHYLGVHFIDENADYHYGWIRCDVKDEGRTLIIKDYAYEKFIEHEIIAGDTIGYMPFGYDSAAINPATGIENALTVVQVYSFEKSIYIQLAVIMPKAQVSVYDLTRKEIYTSELTNLSTVIPVNAPKGMYFVEIIAEEGRFTKKVYLD